MTPVGKLLTRIDFPFAVVTDEDVPLTADSPTGPAFV